MSGIVSMPGAVPEPRQPNHASPGHPVGADLPAAPHGRVDDRVLAAAIGGGFGRADDPPGLLGQQRQRDGADALDGQRRRQKLGRAGGEEVAGPADCAEQRSEFGGKGQHGRDNRNVGTGCRSYARNPRPATGSWRIASNRSRPAVGRLAVRDGRPRTCRARSPPCSGSALTCATTRRSRRAAPRVVQRCRVGRIESAPPHPRVEVRRRVARGIAEPANV